MSRDENWNSYFDQMSSKSQGQPAPFKDRRTQIRVPHNAKGKVVSPPRRPQRFVAASAASQITGKPLSNNQCLHLDGKRLDASSQIDGSAPLTPRRSPRISQLRLSQMSLGSSSEKEQSPDRKMPAKYSGGGKQI